MGRSMIAPARDEGTGRDRRLRRDYRAWVRTHHPDLGGDPEVFAAGLAVWRAQAGTPASDGRAQVSVFRSRGGLWQVVRWWHRRGHRHRPERRVL